MRMFNDDENNTSSPTKPITLGAGNVELEIAEYLLKHQDGIGESLKAVALETDKNPILRTYFREAVVQEVIIKLTEALQLNYEEVASIVDYNYVICLLGEEFFRL
jgi:hypothetical protein